MLMSSGPIMDRGRKISNYDRSFNYNNNNENKKLTRTGILYDNHTYFRIILYGTFYLPNYAERQSMIAAPFRPDLVLTPLSINIGERGDSS